MMDHSLRSISYIADIGDLLVIMARRRIMPQDGEELQVIGSTPKMICHVFESEEVRVLFPFPRVQLIVGIWRILSSNCAEIFALFFRQIVSWLLSLDKFWFQIGNAN